MNTSETLRAIISLLLLSVITGCSNELQPASGEWIPVEINIGGIEQIEISQLGTKAWDTELPNIIKSKFDTDDVIKLTYTEDSNPVTVSFKLNNSGKWEKTDGTPFMIRASANNAPVIKAEYGTPIPDDPGYNTTDYLIADATTTYNATAKTYSCNFGRFKRPDDYLCLYIKILIINPPTLDSGESAYFNDAKFYMNDSKNTPTPRFPVTNETIEVFYKGPFTAKGVCLTSPACSRYWDTELDIQEFGWNITTIEFKTGNITPVQLIIPIRPMP